MPSLTVSTERLGSGNELLPIDREVGVPRKASREGMYPGRHLNADLFEEHARFRIANALKGLEPKWWEDA